MHVRRDVVGLPDGQESVREYIRHPGAAVIAARFDDGAILLERQYRWPHRRVMVELPAGKLDPGELPLATAQRELLEETGYVARDWRRLGQIHPSVAYTDETIELFAARGLEKRNRQLDADEFLETFTLPLGEAIDWVRDGRITDAKSVVGLLWLAQFT